MIVKAAKPRAKAVKSDRVEAPPIAPYTPPAPVVHPRMEPGTEFIVRDDGINWIWYRKYKVNPPGYNNAPSWLSPVAEAYRLHKFDERQGANEHPEECTSANYYSRPDYGNIKAFGMDVITRWEARCKAIGVRGDECEKTLVVNGNEYPIHVWMDKRK